MTLCKVCNTTIGEYSKLCELCADIGFFEYEPGRDDIVKAVRYLLTQILNPPGE